jgi:hypothetical protein
MRTDDDDGGEIAAIWTQLEDRRPTVAEQSKTINSLRSEITPLEERPVDEREQQAWIGEENERIRSELSPHLKRRVDRPKFGTDDSPIAPNRAVRRRSHPKRRP